MIFKTYKSTIKTILRTPVTWGAVLLVIVVVVWYSIKASCSLTDPQTFEIIWDTDPRYIISYNLYIQRIFNSLFTGSLMLFSVPALCVIVAGVPLTRDYHDNFFEIEHAGGVSPKAHFWGRLSAVLTFVTVVALFAAFLGIHIYCLSRGGVPSLSPLDYFCDSTVRTLRTFFMAVFPGILVFVSVTFFASIVLKNGLSGTIAGLIYVLFAYLFRTVLRFRMPPLYGNYLSPTPQYLYQYWAYWGTENFNEKIFHNPFTTGQMITSTCCLYALSASLLLFSLICIRKRKV